MAVAAAASLGLGKAAQAGDAPAQGDVIAVRAKAGANHGRLTFRGRSYRCMLGKTGIVIHKAEGDLGTPTGRFPLREVRYRADRLATPATGLPVVQTTATDGWCDEPKDPAYNAVVQMPYRADAEKMWRDDHLYDLLAVIGYNDTPVVPGAGSAIFMHVMRPPTDSHQYTAGCVALELADLRGVLAGCSASTTIDIRQL